MTTLETATGPDRTTSEIATPAPAAAACPPAAPGCSRRALLRRSAAAGAVGGGALVLAACGGDDTAGTGTTSPSSSAAAGGGEAPAGGSAGGSGVAAADVPVGEAVVLDVDGTKHVFAQPTAGEYVAFSAVCTHAGGIVAASGGTEVTCPLHSSVFDAADGAAVLSGPAPSPLKSETVTLDGDQLVLG